MANTVMHATVGVAIATIIPVWWIVLPLAFLSHMFLDLYPETYDVNKDNFLKKKNLFYTIIQLLLIIGIITFLIVSYSWLLWVAAFIANLPDLWDAIYQFVLKKEGSFWFFHPGGKWPFKRYFPWQEFGMRPIQTAVLDLIFVSIILLLLL